MIAVATVAVRLPPRRALTGVVVVEIAGEVTTVTITRVAARGIEYIERRQTAGVLHVGPAADAILALAEIAVAGRRRSLSRWWIAGGEATRLPDDPRHDREHIPTAATAA